MCRTVFNKRSVLSRELVMWMIKNRWCLIRMAPLIFHVVLSKVRSKLYETVESYKIKNIWDFESRIDY